MAHLPCELLLRPGDAGLVHDGAYGLPLPPGETGDLLGLTPVRVSRILRQLRAEGLIHFQQGCLRVLDRDGLRAAAGFDPAYLHRPAEAFVP